MVSLALPGGTQIRAAAGRAGRGGWRFLRGPSSAVPALPGGAGCSRFVHAKALRGREGLLRGSIKTPRGEVLAKDARQNLPPRDRYLASAKGLPRVVKAIIGTAGVVHTSLLGVKSYD